MADANYWAMINMNKFEYMKTYREENRDKLLDRNRQYNIKHREEKRLYARRYYKLNKTKILQDIKTPELREKRRKQNRAREAESIKSWVGFIPLITQCQCCGKEIYFNNKNKMKAIHFDHRRENAQHIKSPTHWLLLHPRTFDNELIWMNFDFGMLCHQCNAMLPTLNRKEWLEKAVAYAAS